MENQIIVDSCCDLTGELKKKHNIKSIPLTMRLGTKEFVDDGSLSMEMFMEEMGKCKEKVSSASPPPALYMEAMQPGKTNYVITLSKELSGSYSSAMMGGLDAKEKGVSDVHVFDSKSASAGETLIAIKLHELISQGYSQKDIVSRIKAFIDNMKTYFVLENYDNLRKNGRMSRVQGMLVQVLNMKLIMGSDGKGNIALFEKARGIKQLLQKLLDMIYKSEKDSSGETLVISHCNNLELADRLKAEIKQRFNFKEIFVVPTGGLSSMYADNKGIIMAF